MDTWGISSGDFLGSYVGLGAAAFAGAYLVRQRVVREREESWSRPRLDDYEVAMLNEGPRLVVAAAAANLREAGTLALREYDRGLIAAHRPAPGAHAIERRVHDAVRGQPAEDRRRLAALETDPAVERIRARLLDLGLLASPRQAVRARLQGLWLVPIVLLGLARIAAGSANGKPVTFILILTGAAASAAAWLALNPPRQTDTGRRLLVALREGESPSVEANLGATVALAGLAQMWVADAALATAIGVPPESAAGGFWGGGGCGGDGCGGGGCGG